MNKKKYIEEHGEEAWRERKREKGRLRALKWRQANRERAREISSNFYANHPERCRAKSAKYRKGNPEKVKKLKREWDLANPEKVEANSDKRSKKGGEQYLKMRGYSQQPVPNARHRVRARHETKYRGIKLLLESFFEGLKLQLHHQWLSTTAEYSGLALVDTERHQRGIISVVYPLEGVITVFTKL